MLMNYLYTLNRLHKYPCYTIELVFDDRKPEIAPGTNVYHVRSSSYMFYKESLCRILETKIPKKYKKIAFLDADLLFPDDEWYSKLSAKLDSYDVVQGFEYAHWLDLTYKHVTLTRESAVKSTTETFSHLYHPGFVWGFRRDWYNRVGFFDLALSGSGDTLSVAGWMKQKLPKNAHSLPHSLRREYDAFCKMHRPKISYLKNVHVFHLYHGSRANRQYVDRHAILNVDYDIRQMISKNKSGVYEWLWSFVNKEMLSYFIARDDDGVEVVKETTALAS